MVGWSQKGKRKRSLQKLKRSGIVIEFTGNELSYWLRPTTSDRLAMDSLYGTQPFEELAYNNAEPTSPTSLEDFYKEQERKDLERRLSRKSLRRRRGRSKSFASNTSGPQSPGDEHPPPLVTPNESGLPPVLENATPPNGLTNSNPGSVNGRGTPTNGTPPRGGGAGGTWSGVGTPEMHTMAWNEPRREYFPPEPTAKLSYDLHNQMIPAIPWTNHHLRPPGAPWPPTSQPRKVFVPQNMNNSTSLIHQANANNPNGSFSNSSSSFTKSSSATNLAPPAIYGPDHVDILDPSDPWGMRWHHDSRYDVGDFTSSTRGNPSATWAGTASPVVDLPRNGPNGRTNGNPHQRPGMKAPSPLSQSTSAAMPLKAGSSISLDTPKQLSRRLSKRNSRVIHSQPGTPAFDQPSSYSTGNLALDSSESSGTKRISGFRSLFSSSSSAPVIDRQRRVTLGSSSAPPTAVGFLGGKEKDARESYASKSQTLNAPPSSYSQRSSLTPSPTKEVYGANGNGANGVGAKRSSYLGRLVKKFSIIRHNTEPGVGDNGMGKRRDRSPNGYTPPNSAGAVGGAHLKRSVSTANGIFPKQPELDTSGAGTGHPKFASAPAEMIESPISMVPELRLTGVQEGPEGGTGIPGNGMGGVGKMGSPLSPIDPAMHRQQQLQNDQNLRRHQQQQQRPLSDGKNSPELRVAGLQFGGLVITNPDARASAASVTDAEVGGKEGGSEYNGSPRDRIRRVEASTPPVGDMHAPPRPPFMRNAGAGVVGGTSSAETSPNVDYTPLRVVNGREETETETETEGKGLRDIPSPLSPTSTLPALPSPRRTIYSENGSQAQLLLSAIPSIPDLPNVSPFNPARSLRGGETDSPRSDAMETALEFMSPPVSSLSINRPPRSTSRAASNHSLAKPDEGSPARKPSPDQRQQQRPLSVTSSGTTKTSSVAGSIPASTSSTSTNATSSTATTTRPPINSTATSTIKLPTNASDYDYETATPPPARRRAPSSAATVSTAPGSDGQGGGGSRFGAYYSPGTFPSLAIPPGTPQQPGSQRHSLLSLENNPLPTPPARLPVPLLSESGSRERLRTKSGSAERLRTLSGAGNSSSERLRTQSQSGSAERERLMSSSSKERLNSQKSKETIRDTREVRSSPSGRPEAPSSSSSRSIPSNVVDLSLSPRSTPTFDRPSSKEKRSERETPSYGRDREVEVMKERRNQSTFRIPGESSDSRPSSRDLPASSASSTVAGTGSGVRERTRSTSKEALGAAGPNPSRSRVESGNYDVTSSRPAPKHTNSYHSTASSLRDSDPEAEARRKRTNSSAGSDQRNGANVLASAGSVAQETRRRTNSTRGASSAASSSRAATLDSVNIANGKQSSKPEPRRREEPEQEDPSKLVIAGLGQNWEVVEAVMFQPEAHRSSSAPTKKQASLPKESSTPTSSSSRPSSNGTVGYPARTTSRPGFNAAGEPIAPSGPPPRVSSSRRNVTSPTREQFTTSPTRDIATSPTREMDRPQVSQRDRERIKTVDSTPSSTKPVIPTRSKSRPREGSLPANVNLNKPVPPRPPPTPVPEPQALPNGSREYPSRRESIQRMRPTSEVVNVAELGAQEAWEYDRTTARGQSVLFPDTFSVSSPASHRASASSSVLLQNQNQNGPGSPGPPGAGSAHTVFKVQPPFQARTAPPGGYYYPNHQPIPNPLPAPPVILPPKSTRNRI